jgi:hypothetical protein
VDEYELTTSSERHIMLFRDIDTWNFDLHQPLMYQVPARSPHDSNLANANVLLVRQTKGHADVQGLSLRDLKHDSEPRRPVCGSCAFTTITSRRIFRLPRDSMKSVRRSDHRIDSNQNALNDRKASIHSRPVGRLSPSNPSNDLDDIGINPP